jgi:glycosyltransferase involved in cell wall biosynthesis
VEYTKNIAKALYELSAERRADFELVPISAGPVPDNLYADMPPEFFASLLQPGSLPQGPVTRGRWKARLNRLLRPKQAPWLEVIERSEADFLYPSLPSRWRRTPRTATWIPDFQHRYYPDFFTEKEVRERDSVHGLVARHAPIVVFSSQSVKEDWGRFYPRAIDKARVLRFRTVPAPHWWSGDPVATQQRYHLPDRFFIVCNQFWQHKNHRVVFEAIRLLQKRGLLIQVACTGPLEDYRQAGYAAQVRQWLHEFGIAERVHLLGLLPRTDQIQLIRRSLAMIQPSLFEGWSTLVEDGRCLGKRMLISDIAVHQEQDPPGAVYFSPANAGELAERLAEWWERLSPGPDNAVERAARQRQAGEIREFAERFLTLARQAA